MLTRRTLLRRFAATAALGLLAACGNEAATPTQPASSSAGQSPQTQTIPTPTRSSVASIPIGAVLPLSGAWAQQGQYCLNGIHLAAERINAEGGIKSLGGARLEIISSDCTSDIAQAGSNAQRFISQYKVVAILGSFSSSLTLAVSELTERRQIPMLTMSYSDQVTGRGFKYIFQVPPKASVIGQKQLEYTRDIASKAGEQLRNLAVIYEDDAYGQAQAKGIRETAANLQLNVVFDEAFPVGIADATPLATKVRSTDAQVIFLIAPPNDTLTIIRALRQQQITLPVIGGSSGFVIPDFQVALGDLAEGIMSINTANWDLAPELGQLYEQRYGVFATHEALEHAATVDILAQALEIAGDTAPEAIREALLNNRFEGGFIDAIPGRAVDFDETGLNTLSFPIMCQWQQGKLLTVYPPDVATAEPIWSR